MRKYGLRAMDPGELKEGFRATGPQSSTAYARIMSKRLHDIYAFSGLKNLFSSILFIRSSNVSTQKSVSAKSFKGQEKDPFQKPAEFATDAAKVIRRTIEMILGDNSIDGEGNILEGLLDSLSAVEIASNLQDSLKVQLPATLLFDYPSLPALAQFASDKISAPQDLAVQENDIIGVKYEKTANLVQATSAFRKPGDGSIFMDSISLTPYSRWSVVHYDRLIPSFGSWLSKIDHFDNEVFAVTQNEALVMDPQHRLILECSLECTTAFASPKHDDTGVFVGIQHSEYAGIFYEFNQKLSVFSATSGALSVAAGRLSYYFGMKGPSLSIDTACSSALVSIHFGRNYIENGYSSSLVCSANLMISRRTTESAMMAGMLTISGRSKTLDATADGYVRAEGCGAIQMHSITQYEHNVGHISIFFITGSCVNQDGRSSSLTAPNGPSQTLVVSGAMESARSNTSTVSIYGLHGTGTALGDPIEIGALSSIWGHNQSVQYLSGSKSTYGHAEPASGMIGMEQATVCLQNHLTGIMSHLRNMNPHVSINLSQASAAKRIHVSRQTGPLIFSVKHTNLLRHGLSAFAFQGTNSHVIFSSSVGVNQLSRAQKVMQWKRAKFWYKPDTFVWAQSHKVLAAARSNFSINLNQENVSFLMDHVVARNILIPAVGLLELALCCSMSMQSHGISGISNSIITRKIDPTVVTTLDVINDLISGKIEILQSQLTSFTAATSNVSKGHSPFNERLGFLQKLYANLVHRASKILKLNIKSPWKKDMMIGNIEESSHKSAQPSSWQTSPAEFDAVNQLSIARFQPGDITHICIPATIEFYIYQSHVSSIQSTKAGQCLLQIEDFNLLTDLIHVTPSSQETRAMKINSKPLHQKPKKQIMESEALKSAIEHVSIDIVQKTSSIIEQVLNVQVPLDLPLVAAGMDSITSVDLRDHLNKAFLINLDPTVVYDYPTASALAGHIMQIKDLDRVEKQEEAVHEEVVAAIESSVQVDVGIEYPILSNLQVHNNRTVHLDGMSSKLPEIAGRQVFACPPNELCTLIPKQVRSLNSFF